jgi:hypothetical protein
MAVIKSRDFHADASASHNIGDGAPIRALAADRFEEKQMRKFVIIVDVLVIAFLAGTLLSGEPLWQRGQIEVTAGFPLVEQGH